MIHLEIFGKHVAVRGQPEFIRSIEALWSPFVRPLAELPDNAVTLAATAPGLAHSLSSFAVEINRIALDACPDLAIHSGVVDVGGVTLALPGRSGAGKSTLTAACVLLGMGYVSDEALCLPYETSNVRAYARPIALSLWSMRALGVSLTASSGMDQPNEPHEATEFIVAPSAVGETCATPGPLRHVVVPRRFPNEEPQLASLHRADAIALMLRLSFNHFRRGTDAFELMAETLRAANTWELRYSDPLAAARLLIERFAE